MILPPYKKEKNMNFYYEAFKNYFEPLIDAPCPKTEALIKSGVQQKSSGYIEAAKGLFPIDFTLASPPQGWHWKYYIENVNKDTARPTSITCIELLFWMCEVTKICSDNELKTLAQTLKSLNRKDAVKVLKPKYFNKIIEKVKAAYTAA